MAEVIFLVIVLSALFYIEGNRAKQLEKLENRMNFYKIDY